MDFDAGPLDAMPVDAEVVLAPAELSANERPRAFGDVTVGGMSDPIEVIVVNTGQQASGALTVMLTGDTTDFAIVPTGGADDCFGAILEPQESCKTQVQFAPDTTGVHDAHLTVEGDPGGRIDVDFTGNGLTPGDLDITMGEVLPFAPTEITLSATAQTVTVQNNGDTATGNLTVMLGDELNYSKSNDTCHGQPLGAGLTCSLMVTFHPTSVGSLPTQVSIRESPTVGVAATASGTGTARVQVTPPTGGTISSSGGELNCGATCGPVSFDASPIMVTATSTPGYEFGAWTGACADTLGPVCSLVLDERITTVGATFNQLDCIPDASYCDDATGRFIDCGPTGEIVEATICPLGCAETSEDCLDVDPSNDLALLLDMSGAGPDVSFGGASTINTNTGVVTNNGTAITLPTMTVGTPSPMRVFMLNSLSIAGTLKVTTGSGTQNRALVFLVDGDVSITGTLDVSADLLTFGPGGRMCLEPAAEYTGAGPSPGGGGGGHAYAGASGGAAGNGVAGRTGVGPSGEMTLEPLVGGCRGGYVWDSSNEIAASGGGGGAVQIVSRTQISLTGSGRIDASGGGGSGAAGSGGAGGGAGGGVLLEAPTIVVNGTGAVVSTKGGGGAAAGSAVADGDDGGTGTGVAAGGNNGSLAAGGNGGNRLSQPTPGSPGTTSTADGGGGGGSIGVARFNNAAGTFNTVNGGRIESAYTAGVLGSRPLTP